MRNEINCSVNVAHPYDNNVDMYSVVYLCLRSIYEYITIYCIYNVPYIPKYFIFYILLFILVKYNIH